ncbi:MAG TPA: GerMN domain-containing protein [Candidatus Angelobacter sp.]|nr:GerMN domain-containing protein [Candidatus Angelobacter sp.]
MSPKLRLGIAIGFVFAVLAAAIYFPILKRRVKKQAQVQQKSEEQARLELVQSLNAASNEPKVKAKLFWAADAEYSDLVANTVELPLSNDPVLRSKQVLSTLLAGPVDSELRTLPPDAALLAFYILPDGTAVADFSDAMANSIPSGVQSEQFAVDSITRTLEANVPQVRRLRILIHGQAVETLAGHLDLSGTFPVSTKPVSSAPAPAGVPTAK